MNIRPEPQPFMQKPRRYYADQNKVYERRRNDRGQSIGRVHIITVQKRKVADANLMASKIADALEGGHI